MEEREGRREGERKRGRERREEDGSEGECGGREEGRKRQMEVKEGKMSWQGRRKEEEGMKEGRRNSSRE